MSHKSGRARSSGDGPGRPPAPVDVVFFPKRATAPAAAEITTEEIHTERLDTAVEERVTDPGAPDLHERPTEREMRAVQVALMTPQEPPAAIGGLADPASTLAYHRVRLRELVATTPPDRPLSDLADLSLFGHSLLEQGRVEEARVVFEGIVAREPPEAFPYAMLGAVYLAQGDDARAIALFEAALHVDPRDPASRVHRAELRLRRGDRTGAHKDLSAVVAADPDAREPMTARARELLGPLSRRAARPR